MKADKLSVSRLASFAESIVHADELQDVSCEIITLRATVARVSFGRQIRGDCAGWIQV